MTNITRKGNQKSKRKTTMKKQQNNSTRGWALHVALSIALLSISAVLLASSFKATPATRGLSAPINPVAAGDKELVIAGPASALSLSPADAPFTFDNTGSLGTAREVHTATLLPNGKVLVAGGFNNTSHYLDSAELYDIGLGFMRPDWQPQIATATSSLITGSSLILTGSRFQGISEASSGNGQDSSTNYPVVQLRAIDNSQVAFLPVDPIAGWSDTAFTSTPVNNFPAGPALVTVFTDGIPSDSKYLAVAAPTPTPTPTATATATATATFTPTPTATATSTPTATATATATPTATATATATPTATPTSTPTPTPTPTSVCPQPQGYWKNNPDAWPVNSLTLGNQSYLKTELLIILNTPIGSGKNADASLILADQLIAAKLNIANGSDPAPVSSTITHSDSLLSGFSGKLPYHVKPSSANGQAMVNDATVLESYNKGALTAGCTP
jgi:hypothetical protein